jgi:predicted O-linked N-acetylglucosamine transferase (SPINDLY family)
LISSRRLNFVFYSAALKKIEEGFMYQQTVRNLDPSSLDINAFSIGEDSHWSLTLVFVGQVDERGKLVEE